MLTVREQKKLIAALPAPRRKPRITIAQQKQILRALPQLQKPKKLSIAQQKRLLDALPASRINACKKHVKTEMQKGEGFMDILKSIGKVLGPIALELAPPVLKGFLKKIIPGSGLSLAGGSCGSCVTCGGALKLAGQGRRRRNPCTRKYF